MEKYDYPHVEKLYPNALEDNDLAFKALIDILKKLRSPDGCPWDREQTPDSLKHAFIEETFELLEGIRNNDLHNIKEELGDLYLLTSMVSLMYEESNSFAIKDSLLTISEKLIRRHPHVFSDIKLENSHDVLIQWEEIKKNEKTNKTDNTGLSKEITSVLKKTGRSLPPLEKSHAVLSKAEKYGFRWNNAQSALDKLKEELQEIQSELDGNANQSKVEEEIGDLFLALVSFSHTQGVHPSEALDRACSKFQERFFRMESMIPSSDHPHKLKDLNDREWQELWLSSK